MLQSMTGFGDAKLEMDGYSFLVEIKSLNNRFLKTSIRLPEALNSLAFSFRPSWITSFDSPSSVLAYSRTSWVIFMEQKCGPHMEQKWATLCASFGNVWS